MLFVQAGWLQRLGSRSRGRLGDLERSGEANDAQGGGHRHETGGGDVGGNRIATFQVSAYSAVVKLELFSNVKGVPGREHV